MTKELAEIEPAAAGGIEPINVAIVEDDERVRRGLAAIIARTDGMNCVGEYPNGESAVAGITHLPARVVLVDINLPGINGVECVRRLAPLMPNTSMIMLTVHQDTDTIFEALRGGAVGYLLKPVGKDELLDAIRSVVQGGAPMSSSIARKVVQSFQSKPPGLAGESLAVLSDRERSVIELLAQGHIYKEIAEKLDISIWTVSTYVKRIYEKLHVNSRAEIVAKFRQS